VKTIHQYDTVEKKLPVPELALVPVAMCRDPFRQGRHKIVLCTLAYIDQPTKRIGKSLHVSIMLSAQMQKVSTLNITILVYNVYDFMYFKVSQDKSYTSRQNLKSSVTGTLQSTTRGRCARRRWPAWLTRNPGSASSRSTLSSTRTTARSTGTFTRKI